jgi:hypothetical protein
MPRSPARLDLLSGWSEQAESALSLPVPEVLVERIAERAAELVAERFENRAEDDGWLRGADAISAYIGAPPSRVYALANCKPPRIPIERDGSSLVARRSMLDDWIAGGGGKRP